MTTHQELHLTAGPGVATGPPPVRSADAPFPPGTDPDSLVTSVAAARPSPRTTVSVFRKDHTL